jgi:hypothetical protein
LLASDVSAQILRFLVEQRLKLFNVRQDHEWRVYFASVVLLGGVDAAVLTERILLEGSAYVLWVGVCVLTFFVCFGYELDLQDRNRADRRVLDYALRLLSAMAGEAEASVLTWGVETPLRKRWPSAEAKHKEDDMGLWAFKWQMIALALIALVSAALPCLLPLGLRR